MRSCSLLSFLLDVSVCTFRPKAPQNQSPRDIHTLATFWCYRLSFVAYLLCQEEETPWKKLTEKLTCLKRCLQPATLFFCNCLVTLEKLRLWAHERTLVSHETWTIWKQSKLRTFSVRSLVITERLTKFWKTEAWKKEETPWKKLTEKL